MIKKIYLPIKSINLSNYYRTGLIIPANYTKDRNIDIQTNIKDYILLSSKKNINGCDCALEIVFNPDEKQPEKVDENFYLFDRPIPVSRVKKIYFKGEEQKINTVFNIENGAAFLPKTLISVEPNVVEELDYKEKLSYKDNNTVTNWRTEIEKYDRVLGGISTMRIARKDYENYPMNYFGVLSIFNKKIEDEIKVKDIGITMNYSWAFQATDKYKPLYEMIYNEVNNSTVEKIGEEKEVDVKKKNGLFQLDKIDSSSNVYLAAILATYGLNKMKKKDDFIADFIANKFDKKKLEGIALIFGINNGYKGFRNEYNIGGNKTEIKFKLNSKLDFYTIESVYQFVFNSKSDNMAFSYLDDWCCGFEKEENLPRDYFTILDKPVFLPKSLRTKVIEPIEKILKEWFPKFGTSQLTKIAESLEKGVSNVIKEIGNELNEVKQLVEEKEFRLREAEKEISKKEAILNRIEKEKDEIGVQLNEVKQLVEEKEFRLKEAEKEISDKEAILNKIEKEKKSIEIQLEEEKLLIKEKNKAAENLNKSNNKIQENLRKEEVQTNSLFSETEEDLLVDSKRFNELNDFTLVKLKETAKSIGIEGLSKMNKKTKKDFIVKIINAENNGYIR